MALNVAGAAATVLAISSVAWYYHMFGPELHAMTPAEEGSATENPILDGH